MRVENLTEPSFKISTRGVVPRFPASVAKLPELASGCDLRHRLLSLWHGTQLWRSDRDGSAMDRETGAERIGWSLLAVAAIAVLFGRF